MDNDLRKIKIILAEVPFVRIDTTIYLGNMREFIVIEEKEIERSGVLAEVTAITQYNAMELDMMDPSTQEGTIKLKYLITDEQATEEEPTTIIPDDPA